MSHSERELEIGIVGGNSQAFIRDKQEEKEELYLCNCCSTFVSISHWDPMIKSCKDCLDEGDE